MTLQLVKGDLFDPAHEFDGYAQGVNTQGAMGAGIAVPFKEKWPEMYKSYHKLCSKYGEALSGLAHVYHKEMTGETGLTEDGCPQLTIDFGVSIYNLFTQTYPGQDNAELRFVKTSAILMRQDAENHGDITRIGLPWIGCGIGGLERHNVWTILETVLRDSKIEFVVVEQ